jgi:hypothetical protein
MKKQKNNNFKLKKYLRINIGTKITIKDTHKKIVIFGFPATLQGLLQKTIRLVTTIIIVEISNFFSAIT